jgi:GTPase SAR1 family protein
MTSQNQYEFSNDEINKMHILLRARINKHISENKDQKLAEKIANEVNKINKDYNHQVDIINTDVDILVLGRSGVGKSTFLGSLIGESLGSPSMNHGTRYLIPYIKTRYCDNETINIRYWDSKGIDNWEQESESNQFIEELRIKNINPLIVFYCARDGGRTNYTVVKKLLSHFFNRKLCVFYIITNMFSMSTLDLVSHKTEAYNMLCEITNCGLIRKTDEIFDINSDYYKGGLVLVNSSKYESQLGYREQRNINELMMLVISKLDSSELSEFILATLNNYTFWGRTFARLKQSYEMLTNNIIYGIDMLIQSAKIYFN